MIIRTSIPLTKLRSNGITSVISNSLKTSSELKINLGIVLMKKLFKTLARSLNKTDHLLSNKSDHTTLVKKGDGINENSFH